MDKRLIYGKDETQGVTSVEIEDNVAEIFTQSGSETRPNEFWTLMDSNEIESIPLKGDLHYKYAKKYETEAEFKKDTNELRYRKGVDTFSIWNPKEAFMVKHGLTYYKGMQPKEVSILTFDLETTSLVPSHKDKVLLISNTFRDSKGNVERRLFCYDDFNSTKEMIYAWCSYVCEKDPSVIAGHNILGFDLPYLRFYVDELRIGKGRRGAKFAERTSEFRKDGSQTYTFTNVLGYGREIIDTMFLAIKYDAASRKYESYGLKRIISQEGLERTDRQFYDASEIRLRYQDAGEWAKIKAYAEHDADDALALWDLMIPSYFYFAQAVPKSLQQIINGASGAQVNSWMLRAYLQDGHSIPKASDPVDFVGAISFGNPGIYKKVCKVDVASLYPSIILEEKIYDKSKDPKFYFLQMVQHFTSERLLNKRLASETGDRKFKDLEQSQKIFINSAYGFLGASGLNFNSPRLAARVTEAGRQILQRGMDWANKRGFGIANGDTDSSAIPVPKTSKRKLRTSTRNSRRK
jgi:DNA polymerase, archaea type